MTDFMSINKIPKTRIFSFSLFLLVWIPSKVLLLEKNQQTPSIELIHAVDDGIKDIANTGSRLLRKSEYTYISDSTKDNADYTSNISTASRLQQYSIWTTSRPHSRNSFQKTDKGYLRKTVTQSEYSFDYHVPPVTKCSDQSDCEHAALSNSTCKDGYCQCNESCWIFIPNINYPMIGTYTCGTCGVLGSQCENNAQCAEPGVCTLGNICHCSSGTHSGTDICVVVDIRLPLVLFFSFILFFVILGLLILGYSFFVNYRRTGYCCWCRDPSYPGLRLQLTGRHRVMGPPKSPAFTMNLLDDNMQLETYDLNAPSTSDAAEDQVFHRTFLSSPTELLGVQMEDRRSSRKRRKLVQLSVSTLDEDTDINAKDINTSTDTENKGTEILEIVAHSFRTSDNDDTSGMTLYFEQNEASIQLDNSDNKHDQFNHQAVIGIQKNPREENIPIT